VTGGWKKLHNVELYNCALQKILLGSSVMEYEIGGECSMHGEVRNAYGILVGELEGKSPLRRPTTIYLVEIGLESVDWIYLAHDRDVWWALLNIVMNVLFP
jgi:hypothetical protein